MGWYGSSNGGGEGGDMKGKLEGRMLDVVSCAVDDRRKRRVWGWVGRFHVLGNAYFTKEGERGDFAVLEKVGPKEDMTVVLDSTSPGPETRTVAISLLHMGLSVYREALLLNIES